MCERASDTVFGSINNYRTRISQIPTSVSQSRRISAWSAGRARGGGRGGRAHHDAISNEHRWELSSGRKSLQIGWQHLLLLRERFDIHAPSFSVSGTGADRGTDHSRLELATPPHTRCLWGMTGVYHMETDEFCELLYSR